jgi:hypothetical protein
MRRSEDVVDGHQIVEVEKEYHRHDRDRERTTPPAIEDDHDGAGEQSGNLHPRHR